MVILMTEFKRLTLFCGHYGSGKTNVAVNVALMLKKQRDKVSVADLDIVNPYFRTKDSIDDFNEAGIHLICSEYANSNVDIPALPQEMYSIIHDKSTNFVLDIGGDDRGALALGRLAPAIIEENEFEMLMVINKYRPLTPDAASTIEVMREIECASGMKFTGLVNNSNLGAITTAEDVLNSLSYADEVAQKSGLSVVMTTVTQSLFEQLDGKVDNLLALRLQNNLLFNGI